MSLKFLNNIFLKVFPQRNFIIPEGVIIDGFVYANTPATIAGTINGDFFATAMLHIAKTGTVNGDVKAWDLEISGTVNGNITCNKKINLQPECYVHGNVSAPEVITANNILVKGTITKNGVAEIRDVKSDFLLKENNMIKELEEKEALKEAEKEAWKQAEEQTLLESLMIEPVKKAENWF